MSKTALLLGDTSNRYQLPVYGMIVLLLFRAVWVLWKRVLPEKAGDLNNRRNKLWRKENFCIAAGAACLLLDLAGLLSGKVVFLYPEDREQLEFNTFMIYNKSYRR